MTNRKSTYDPGQQGIVAARRDARMQKPAAIAERLSEIKEEIKELAREARNLLPRDSMTRKRAESYWFPHILGALDNDNDYLGGSSMITMAETIDGAPRR